MGLIGWISALAAERVHVLIVEVPGSPALRMRTEAAVLRRGWVLADSPADADALLICGEPDAHFARRIDAVWAQLPGPRHHAMITGDAGIGTALDAVPSALTDLERQDADARSRPQRVATIESDGELAEPHHHDMHEMHDMHDAHSMDAHSMDMSSMHMSGPAGIPLASGDDGDRDGLEMDVTHLTLGPILPHWPSSLVVHTSLSGDLVVSADLEWLAPPADFVDDPLLRAADYMDDALRVISIAGWESIALRVRRVRDDLLDGGDTSAAAVRLRGAAKRIRRSRTLAWSLAGIPSVGSVGCRGRLLGWMQAALDLLDGGDPGAATAPWTLDDLRDAIVGQELSTVRLIIASAGERGIRSSTEVRHG